MKASDIETEQVREAEADDEQQRVQARTAIKQLFELMGIQRVVCVDDEYGPSVRVEDAIGLYAQAQPECRRAIPELTPVNEQFEAATEGWQEALRELWDTLDEEKRSRVYGLLRDDGTAERDPEYARLLKDLLEEHHLYELSFAQWHDRKEQFFGEVEQRKTLFLFDQDASKEDRSSTEGIGLIEEVFSRNLGELAICGLLSHRFAPEDEYEEWENLRERFGDDRDKFVLISKRRLEADALGFARMVKLSVLSTPCALLRDQASTVIDAAHKQAREKIDTISIFDFDYIVFLYSALKSGPTPARKSEPAGGLARSIARPARPPITPAGAPPPAA